MNSNAPKDLRQNLPLLVLSGFHNQLEALPPVEFDYGVSSIVSPIIASPCEFHLSWETISRFNFIPSFLMPFRNPSSRNSLHPTKKPRIAFKYFTKRNENHIWAFYSDKLDSNNCKTKQTGTIKFK